MWPEGAETISIQTPAFAFVSGYRNVDLGIRLQVVSRGRSTGRSCDTENKGQADRQNSNQERASSVYGEHAGMACTLAKVAMMSIAQP